MCVGANGSAVVRSSRMDSNAMHGATMTGGSLALSDTDLRYPLAARPVARPSLAPMPS